MAASAFPSGAGTVSARAYARGSLGVLELAAFGDRGPPGGEDPERFEMCTLTGDPDTCTVPSPWFCCHAWIVWPDAGCLWSETYLPHPFEAGSELLRTREELARHVAAAAAAQSELPAREVIDLLMHQATPRSSPNSPTGGTPRSL
jgi:hypothetical protein